MDASIDVARLRKEYTLRGLHRSDLLSDPLEQFSRWFAESVQSAGSREPNAVALATATTDGHPSARGVLLKGFDHEGFVFFTNYERRKGEELPQNTRSARDFHWSWVAG